MNASRVIGKGVVHAKVPKVCCWSEKYEGADVRRDSREAFDLSTEAYQAELETAETSFLRQITG